MSGGYQGSARPSRKKPPVGPESGHVAADPARRFSHAGRIGNVEPEGFGARLARRGGGRVSRAGGQHDRVTAPGQLAADLQPDPAVAPVTKLTISPRSGIMFTHFSAAKPTWSWAAGHVICR